MHDEYFHRKIYGDCLYFTYILWLAWLGMTHRPEGMDAVWHTQEHRN